MNLKFDRLTVFIGRFKKKRVGRKGRDFNAPDIQKYTNYPKRTIYRVSQKSAPLFDLCKF